MYDYSWPWKFKLSSHLTQRLFLHYLGKLENAKYYIIIQGSIIIYLQWTHIKRILSRFLSLMPDGQLEFERSFGGQLCQEYLYQKTKLKSVYSLSSYDR